MSEYRRVLLSRKNIGLLLACVLIGCFLFYYECKTEKNITSTGEELQQYVEEYPAFLERVEENAASLERVAVMKEGFAYDNIQKTVRDYKSLGQPVLNVGENRGIVLYTGFQGTDLLMVAAVLILTAGFAEEKKKGLNLLVQSTKGGRRRLVFSRICCILLYGCGVSLCMWGGCMLVAAARFGTAGLFRALQSVPEFALCPLRLNIIEYMLLSVLLKGFALGAAGLLLYMLLSWFDQLIAAVLSVLVLAVEYLMYALIRPTDSYAWLKFCNVMALLRTDVFFKNYKNLNLFGHAVGFLSAAVICIGAVFLVIVLLCMFRPFHTADAGEIGTLAADRLQRTVSRCRPLHSLFGWELKKTLFVEKGLLVLAAVIYVSIVSTLQYQISDFKDPVVAEYYRRFSGVMDDKLEQKVQKEYDQKVTAQENVQSKILEMLETEEAGEEVDEDTLAVLMQKSSDLSKRLEILEYLLEKIQSGRSFTEQTGIEVELFDTSAYDTLLVQDRQTTEKNSIYLLLGVIGIFAGSICAERQSNMRPLQRSVKRGRGTLLAGKIGVLVVLGAVLCAGVHGAQAYQIGKAIGFSHLETAVQALDALRSFPLHFTIRGYLIFAFCIRLLGTVSVGLLMMVLSAHSKNKLAAMGFGVLLFVAPVLLRDVMGLPLAVFVDWAGFCGWF